MYITGVHGVEPRSCGLDNISHELGMNKNPKKIAEYQNRNQSSALSRKSNKSKGMSPTQRMKQSLRNINIGKPTVARLRGQSSFENPYEKTEGSFDTRSVGSQLTISKGGDPSSPDKVRPKKPRGIQQSDSQKALALAKKMAEYYATQVVEVPDWTYQHEPCNLSDGTDIEKHIGKHR